MLTFDERIAEYQEHLQKKSLKLKEEELKKQISECTFFPSTNEHTGRKDFDDFLQKEHEHQHLLKANREFLRHKKSELELNELLAVPLINDKTKLIAERVNKTGEDVFGRLSCLKSSRTRSAPRNTTNSNQSTSYASCATSSLNHFLNPNNIVLYNGKGGARGRSRLHSTHSPNSFSRINTPFLTKNKVMLILYSFFIE